MPRKPGPQITAADVVGAAAVVLARDGYDGLTMRAVATELGVRAPSLYWHVKSKDDLSLLLFDHLIDNLDYAAPSGDWRGDLRRMAERLRARLVGTRDITRLFPESYASGPRATRSLELGLGLLRQAGLPAAEALHAYGVALSFIVGWSRFEVTRRANEAMATPAEVPDFHALPNLAWAVAGGGAQPGYDDGFRYGIDLLIAGLEQRLDKSPAR
ncbi:MAG TPA: TetR/AcrR family transcriptional regulator C-terminal domain-containing protein [Caulobacteraceae bacterium]|jgi:TetR/AcrR family tetracycline transcriptional repressor